MNAEEAWGLYHEFVERRIRDVQYGDPSTDRDNKATPMAWEMREVFLLTWTLRQSEVDALQGRLEQIAERYMQ